MTDTSRPRQVHAPSTADLARAAAVVAKHLRPTPVIEVERPNGGRLALKLETLQPTGAFKVRGALAALDAYAALGRPVVTASAGNHGLGVGFASALLGVPAQVVVPRTASPAKVDGLRRLGADLVLYGDGYDEAEQHALELAEQGAAYLSAYNDPHRIGGGDAS